MCVRLHLVSAGELGKGIGGGFFEAGETAAKNKLHFVGRAIALFGDENVGHVALFGSGVKVKEIGAIDENDDVGILFDGARLAKIGELRTAFIAFWCAGELAEDENGDLQFLSEALQATGDAGDFFLAGIEAAATGDELKVVDDEEGQTLVALEAAGFGANFEDAGGAGIVDPQGSGSNGAEAFGHALPVLAAQMAGAKFVGVDLSDGGDQTLKQGFLGHFEAEDGDGQAAPDGDVLGKIQREGGFPLRRPTSENDEFGGLQTREQLVQFAVSGGNAGDTFAFAEDFFEAIEIFVDDVFDGEQAGFDAILGELEDFGFGGVEDNVGTRFAFEGLLLDIVGGVDEITEHRFFFDDAGVVLDVGDAGNAVGQAGEIRSATRGFQFSATVQFLGEGNEIDGVLGFAERDHLLKNVAVLRKEEIVGFECLDGGVEGVVVEENSAEDGAFGVEVTGKRTFESGVSGH